nr:MAM and LDL-receptor class A domain-containing protein 1-like [Lytechinus pictus]
MFGAGVGDLNVYLIDAVNGNMALVWSQTGNHGDRWIQGQVSTSNFNSYQIAIEATYGGNYTGDIAIDDTFISLDGLCNETSEWDCDFESDWCGYTQAQDDTFDWTRQSGATTSLDTGPSIDHTTGTATGYYVFIETSSPRIPGDEARFMSTLIPTTSRQCLTFWYHMLGPTVETLNIFTRRNDSAPGYVGRLVWSDQGEKGDLWYPGSVAVAEPVAFQIIFQAYVGASFTGDIAIDDIHIYPGDCAATPTCNFENSLICGYQQDATDNFDWTYGSGDTPTPLTGPSADVTYGTAFGHYMYIEASQPNSPGAVARLIGPHISMESTSAICWSLSFHMYGQDIGSLNILVSQNIINYTECDCDFENGFCTWTNDPTTDVFDWFSGQGGTPSANTGPAVDHTLGTGLGTFIFIETSSPRVSGETARFRSQAFSATPSGGRCLRFWFHMFGTQIGALNVYVETVEGAVRQDVWSYGGNQGDRWNSGQLPIMSQDTYVVVFEGVVGVGFEGDIALDDISFIDSACGVQPPAADVRPTTTPQPYTGTGTPPAPPSVVVPTISTPIFSCDFDSDFCTFTQAVDDDIEWTRLAGSTTSTYTGPENDHTQGTATGYYIYTEASGFFNNIARLESELIPATSGQLCLDFWYHMWGQDMGTLNVYSKVGNTLGQVLWTHSGALARLWYQAQIEIIPTADFKVVFEGITGPNFDSDIALDDIDVSTGKCKGFLSCSFEDAAICGYSQGNSDDFDWSWNAGATPTLYTGPSIDASTGTASVLPTYAEPNTITGSASCDFDSDLCSYDQDIADDFDWLRIQGATTSTNTGPTNDHTSGSGFYVYTESSSPRLPGETARLVSDLQNGTTSGGGCLEFYYHMYGGTIGTLNVKILEESGSETTIFTKGQRDYGNTWHLSSTSIDSNGNNFKIVFEGIIGSSFESDIAIDDVTYHNGVCPPSRTCDLEASDCGWRQETVLDDFDWVRVQASEVACDSLNNDHTTGTPTGHLLLTNATSQNSVGDQALLYSPSYDATEEGDCMTFWYHLHNDPDAGFLAVWESVNGALIGPYWQSTVGVTSAVWQFASVTLKSNATFQVVLQAVLGVTTSHDIAVDDLTFEYGACAPPGFCNFETDYCYWTNTQTGDNFDWTLSSGATPSVTTGPSKDHTLSSPNGHYVFIETSTLLIGDKAWLLSEYSPPSDGCFTFWYHMFGAGVGDLNVYLIDAVNGNMALVWSQTGNHGDRWIQGQVSTSNFNSYQIAIEATYGGNYTGDIAIDDTFISLDGLCNETSEWDCDFESDWCGYTQAQDDTFDWTRQSGATTSLDTGPSIDHTTGTATGYYVFIETSSPRIPGDEARFMSTLIPTTSRQCLTFWYHMFGPTIETLNIFTRRNDTAPGYVGRLVWSDQGEKGDLWYPGSVAVAEPVAFQIIFQAYVGASFTGDIAIDDILIYPGDCAATPTCNFENSLICGYQQDATDNFDWTYGSGDTPTPLTGPSADVTYGTAFGHYMYIEASQPNSPGAVARLIGPHISMESTSAICWSLSFHMYGQDIGSLNILTQNADASTTLVMSLSGNQGNQWYSTAFEVTSNGYEIVFEGVVGQGEEGDIAIDDVKMIEGSCGGLLDCDFEDQRFCQWTNGLNDEFDWIRVQGGTPSASTGPLYDHTIGSTGSGYYVYIEGSSPQIAGDTAKLQSPVYTTDGNDVCFTFWFNMYGTQVADLRLYKYDLSSGTTNSADLVWLLYGQQSTDQTHWIQGQVALNGEFTLEFWGVVGVGFYSDIAIDDILVVQGTCDVLPPEADPNQVGQGISCSFDGTICTWTQDINDQFDWLLASGSTPSVDTGPSGDHTSGTGGYVFTEASAPRLPGDIAILTSSKMDPTGPSGGCFVWWYHMYGGTMGTFNVYQENNGVRNQRWSRTGDQTNEWLMAQLWINSTDPTKILFEGIIGSSWESDIAIDDITYSEGPCPPPPTCDFSDDICDWSQELTLDDFDWSIGSGADTRYGPTGTSSLPDKTSGVVGGGYAYIDLKDSTLTPGDSAMLNSALRSPPDSGADCLGLWYHIDAMDVGAINVYQLTNGSLSDVLWSISGNRDDYWWFAGVTMISRAPYQAVIEGVVGTGSQGGITIDEVGFTAGPCNPPGHCNFENGMCSWQNRIGDNLDWVRISRSTNADGTGPAYDHTMGNDLGFYMFVDTTPDTLTMVTGDTADLFSEVFDPVDEACFTFWYHIRGNGLASLLGSTLDFSPPSTHTRTQQFNETGDRGDGWLYGQFNVSSVLEYQIVISAVVDPLTWIGDIAIDDTALFQGACGVQRPWSCSFEDGLCNYEQLSDDELDWSFNQGLTPSVETGPSADHTTGLVTGTYLFIETSTGAQGDAARLRSSFAPPSSYCLEFWYHMYGATIGSLNVYIQNNQSTAGLPIWTRSGSLGNSWTRGSVAIVDTYAFRVIYEAVRGSSFTGDIALDDLDLYEGDCKAAHACDFQSPDLCQYTQDDTDDFDWLWGDGSTDTIGTGPDVDATYGTVYGKYMYIDATNRSLGDTARLIGPTFTPEQSGITCWTFYYNMYGADVYTLDVKLQSDLTTSLWSTAGNLGNAWYGQQVTVTSSIPYHVVFEGTVGSGELGDIAIDDIDYKDGPCENSGQKRSETKKNISKKKKIQVPPGFELGSLDSKSRVLTITP